MVTGNNITKEEQFYNDLLGEKGKEKSEYFPGLTLKDEHFIKVLNQIILKDHQNKFLLNCLEDAVGNLYLNKKLGIVLKQKTKRYRSTIKDIRRFSYKTKDIDKFEEVSSKFKRNLNILKKGGIITESEKLTMYDLSVIESLHQSRFLLKKSEILYKKLSINNVLEKVSNFIDQLDKGLDQELQKKKYKSGDILLTRFDRELVYRHKVPNQEEKLTKALISRYSHASQIFFDQQKKDYQVVDIYGEYQNEFFNRQDVLTCDIFRVNVSKLLSKKNSSFLEEKYGKDYQNALAKRFEEEINKLHNIGKQKFKEVQNNDIKRIFAGVAKFIPFGHKLLNPNYNKIAESMSEGKMTKNSMMICSEFVTKATVTALINLNTKLKQEFGTDKNIIELPFKHENLDKVHPERLYKIFEPALEKVEMPDFYKQMVSEKQIRGTIKEQNYNIRLYEQIKELSNQQIDGKRISKDEFLTKIVGIMDVYLEYDEQMNELNLTQNQERRGLIIHSMKKGASNFYDNYDPKQPTSFLGKFLQFVEKVSVAIGIKDPEAKRVWDKSIRQEIKTINPKNSQERVIIEKFINGKSLKR